MNNVKTGGGKPDYIPPDDTLEKVASTLGPTCDGYSVHFGGDAVVMGVEEVEMLEKAVVDLLLKVQPENMKPLVVPAALSPHTPKSKFFFASVTSKGKLKRQTTSDEVKVSIKERNKAIAEYYFSKRKRKKEMDEFKKKIGNV